MTLELTKENVQFAIILVLMVIQIYQHFLIKKQRENLISVWTQVNVVLLLIASKIKPEDLKKPDETDN